ncbi:hypothetical protein NP233_g6855 [Leucocoprinus birnbaumii]|uniref:Uncharacterized protein n=1 Tax=Leucocoprinus birnbaumii TaxID=56174 RepID=A0AAD5VSN4_9AGAR|nr:hypothetical protein NP233_g6855 [Leucocoprinus birnbaumii]
MPAESQTCAGKDLIDLQPDEVIVVARCGRYSHTPCNYGSKNIHDAEATYREADHKWASLLGTTPRALRTHDVLSTPHHSTETVYREIGTQHPPVEDVPSRPRRLQGIRLYLRGIGYSANPVFLLQSLLSLIRWTVWERRGLNTCERRNILDPVICLFAAVISEGASIQYYDVKQYISLIVCAQQTPATNAPQLPLQLRMPSHTPSSALMRLHAFNGAPWRWPVWQERTGIYHGLFPDDDKHLPPGWTRQNSRDVQSYFQNYLAQPSEEKKYHYQSKTNHPGKAVWTEFMKQNWRRWKIHDAVVEELNDWDCHPTTIIIREHNGDQSQWPHADGYAATILNTLGLKLFGEEAFLPNSTTLPQIVRKPLTIFVQRSWDNLRKAVGRLKANATKVEADARASFGELEKGNVTKKSVAKAIRDVAQWKAVSELYNTAENVEKAEEMLGDLQVIMETLGVKIAKERRVSKKSPCKVSKNILNDLATKEDVTDLRNLYHDYFEGNAVDDEEQPLAAMPTALSLDLPAGDIGMDVEATLSSDVLAQRLGFHTGLPPVFNSHRHRAGITPWDNVEVFAQDPIPQELSPLSLHWHQLAGVHSIIRRCFSAKKDPYLCKGVLVADEVGLGKTTQAITLLAFLNQCIYAQENGLPPPPILAERPYLGAAQKIPSHPHLIVCPGTLIAQWVNELRTLFRPKMVDVLVYDSSVDGEHFWGPTGPVKKTLHRQHSVIIVASHSVVATEYRDRHVVKEKPRKGALPWDIAPQKKNAKFSDSLLGQWFLTVTIDEAHHMRNLGIKHSAALRLLQQSTLRLIMTATPLHTSSKDISAIGRLVGLSYFMDEMALQDEKADSSRLRKAKRLDDDGESYKAEQLHITRRLHTKSKDRMLRRTANSKGFDNQPLISLPPYITILAILNLTPREMSIIQDRSEAAKAAILQSTSERILTRKFYLEYRTAVVFANKNPDDPLPKFHTMFEWEEVKSTKIETCSKLCSYYLTHDAVPDVTFENGQAIFPKVEVKPGEEVSKKRRIIIYSEFSSMAPLLQNVLSLHGIPSLAINGNISLEERDRRVKQLYDDNNDFRVLIFSSVGSVGLNLAIADVVIFLDQPWSSQDEQQIIGRAHRQPQKKIVKVFYLLANDSADLLMNTMARNKRDMFDAFVNKELREELQSILEGHVPEMGDPDDAETVEKQEKATRKKAAGASKAKEETIDNGNKGNKPSKRRRRQVVLDEEDGEPSSGVNPSAQPSEISDVMMSDGTMTTDVPPISGTSSASEHEMELDPDEHEASSANRNTNAQHNLVGKILTDLSQPIDENISDPVPENPGSPTRSPPHKRLRTQEPHSGQSSTTGSSTTPRMDTDTNAAMEPPPKMAPILNDNNVEEAMEKLAGSCDAAVLARIRLLLSGDTEALSPTQTSGSRHSPSPNSDSDRDVVPGSSSRSEHTATKPKKQYPKTNAPNAHVSTPTRQFLVPPTRAQSRPATSESSVHPSSTTSSHHQAPSSGPINAPGPLRGVPPKSALTATKFTRVPPKK